MGLRHWLLSRQCQLTLQLSASLVASSLFTLWSPIYFSHACLVPVFVAVIVGSLATDQHIGTRLQVSAWVLGPAWLAAALAGSLMSLAKLAGRGHATQHGINTAYLAATLVLALLGLVLLVFLQAVTPPGPGRVMSVITVLLYGIMVLLSVLYPSISSMWVSGVLYVVLGALIAAVVGLLVGFLVLPSLASDEVWRLTSEALQGAGAVLSYHTSLLMVDDAVAGSHSTAGKDSAVAAPAASKPRGRRGRHGGHHSQQAADRQGGGHMQEQQQEQGQEPANGHHQHHRQKQQQQQQQQHGEWSFQRRQQQVQPSARSSIEIAAAGAAVVAASQDAFKHAAEAAAADMGWVDAADSTITGSAGDGAHGVVSISSARSEHSSTYSIASLVGSDAIADAAAELSKRSATELCQQQQQLGQQQGVAELEGGVQPRLSEQLLLQQQQSAEQQQQGGPTVTAVDAWVCAVSLSRRGSMLSGIRTSEEGSRASSIAGVVGTTSAAGAMQQSGQQSGQQRRSLERGASLDFVEEMDDRTFLQMMRALAHNKGTAAAARPGAAAALPPAASAAAGDSAVRQSASSMARPTSPTGRRLPLSKSVGSALSALSVAGSSAAPAEWARAVPPHKQQPPDGTSPFATDTPFAVAGQFSAAAAGRHTAGAAAQPPIAASVAESFVSSHASVLQQPNSHNNRHQQQGAKQLLAHSRFTHLSDASLAQQQQQQGSGSFSKRPSLGFWPWSFLTQASWVTGAPTAAQPHAPAQQHAGKSVEPAVEPQGSGVQPNGSAGVSQQLLPPPSSSAQLQPLVGRAKAALASARLEPAWLRPKAVRHFDPDACFKLLDDIELLLVRLSTLEGVSEERSLMGLQLHQLAHFKGIADALALIYAQLTAFLVHVATAVGQQETTRCNSSSCGAPGRAQALKAASRQRGGMQHARQLQPQQGSAANALQLPAAAPAATAGSRQRPSPFASAPGGEVCGGADGDGASIGISTLLSGLERQGSYVSSSYLWEQKTGWGQAREMLKREMDACLGSYWWSVRNASKKLPVKVARSREVMVLIALWPVCNGVLEACERIEASAQQVFTRSQPPARPTTPAHTTASAAATATPAQSSGRWQRLLSALHGCVRKQPRSLQEAPQLSQQRQQQHRQVNCSKQPNGHGAASKAPGAGAPAGGVNQPGCLGRVCSAVMRWGHRQAEWVGPLLQLVLVKPAWVAVHTAVTKELPATFSSKQGIRRVLASRNFQASAKLLLAISTVLLLTTVLMMCIPEVAHSVPIFGYAAVVLCFSPRVEATVDQAARRVLGTILGACLGLATSSIPDPTQRPFLLLACLAVASVGLGVLARPQRRTAIVLALITLCAVSLCGYEAACWSPRGPMRPVDTFAARMASVVGGCIFVAIINRLLMPWYTSDYALEQLADALQESVLLFDSIYHSQLERMRLAELVAGQIKQEGPDAVVQLQQQRLQPTQPGLVAPAMPPLPAPAAAAQPVILPAAQQQQPQQHASTAVTVPPAVQLAACEAAERKLLVVLRQQVLSKLVAVQLSLAKESVSWRRGVLATPPLVLNVLGAMNAIKEALASQRLALAPFTRQGAASMAEEQLGASAAGGGVGSGMLHSMVHCYSLWSEPLHPLWKQILGTVHELAAATAASLRSRPRGSAAQVARAQLLGLLQQLEAQRLELRHGWLDIRVRLHQQVHESGRKHSSTQGGSSFWPTDSVHLFTFTYGMSRCLNAFAAAAQAVADSL